MWWTASPIAVCSIALVHAIFMVGELYPWDKPWIMVLVLHDWPHPLKLSDAERHFASMVVHNAGVYNGIVAVGLVATAYVGPSAYPVQIALLTGGIVAGLFGCATLAPKTIVQAVLGAIALLVVIRHHV